MDRLLDEHPIPENYNVQTDFSSSTDSAMKKKSKKKVDYDGQDISASVREKYS